MQTFYYIKLRDPETCDELFKIGICSTSVAERWGRRNGSQFDEIEGLFSSRSRLKKYNTSMEVLLMDSWAFPAPTSTVDSQALAFEHWVKSTFKDYQAVKDIRWSRLKEFVRTGMSELFSKDLYECIDVTVFGDVRDYMDRRAKSFGGKLTSEKEAQKLIAYIGQEKLSRKHKSL